MGNRRLWSVLSVLVLSVLPALAQTQGSISGVVHDPSGAVIPGVTVTVTNPATNFVRAAITNEAGVYNVPSLQPGKYNIKVELPGFRTITQNDVEPQIQQSAQFQIVENHALQFRFEAFNFANHPNWGKPDITRSSPSFGKIRSTRTNMREIQFVLKYMF